MMSMTWRSFRKGNLDVFRNIEASEHKLTVSFSSLSWNASSSMTLHEQHASLPVICISIIVLYYLQPWYDSSSHYHCLIMSSLAKKNGLLRTCHGEFRVTAYWYTSPTSSVCNMTLHSCNRDKCLGCRVLCYCDGTRTRDAWVSNKSCEFPEHATAFIHHPSHTHLFSIPLLFLIYPSFSQPNKIPHHVHTAGFSR